jgi:DNA polymerase-3 subunit gamma/tau
MNPSMSLALYRKYRPATFAELKGQEHVAEPLQQALRNGRINHAYLFSGPRGCGKTSSARILARSLNCEQGPTPDPCGVCDSCVALGPSGSGHIDVIEIDAASHGGVDDARDLRERAFFAPVAARFKIYIIDEAHMVTREGFNALLKLVEEPPPHLKFVFATTEPEKVIGTIRSRTHHYPFRLIPPGVLKDLLEEILKSESVPYEQSALPLVVRAGAGSARDSLSILDQLLAGADEAGITYARAVSLLGYTDSSLLDEVVDAFVARDGGAVFAAVDRVIESGQDPRRFTADLLGRFRDLVILSNVPEAATNGLLDQPADELERMQRQAAGMGRGELTRAADLLHTGLTEMRGATSPRLLLELLCARILLPGAYEDEESVFVRLERLERRLAGGGGEVFQAPPPVRLAQSPQVPPKPTPATPSVTPPATPPPSQGGDPTSIVQRSPLGMEDRPSRPVDNSGDRTGSSAWPEPARANTQQERQAAQQPTPPARSQPEPAAAPGGLNVSVLRQAWPNILETIKHRSRVAWMVLQGGVQVAGLEGNLLTLAFDNEGNRKGFTGGGRDAAVRQAIKEMYGIEVRVDTVPAGQAVPTSRQTPPPQPQAPTPPPPTAAPAPPPGPGPAGHPTGQAPAAPARQPQSPAPQRPAPPPQAAPVENAPRQPPKAPVAPPDLPPPPDEPPPFDESDEVDPEGDRDAGAEEAISGMALIQRELGGQIIKEIDNS